MHANATDHAELLGDTSNRDPSRTTFFAKAAGKLGLSIIIFLGAALAVAMICLVSAPGTGTLAMLAVAATALVAAASAQAASPAFRARMRAIAREAPPVLPSPMELHDCCVVNLLNRIQRARQARDRIAARSPYGERHALSRGRSALAAAERRAIVVAARAEYASASLAALSECSTLEGDAARLRSAEREAACPEAATAYRQAAEWAGDRQDAIRRLESRRAALVARLEQLVAMLESMPAKSAHLELQRIEQSDDLLGTEIDEAESELAEIAGFPCVSSEAQAESRRGAAS
jgi:hypothetical protein